MAQVITAPDLLAVRLSPPVKWVAALIELGVTSASRSSGMPEQPTLD